MTWDLIRQLSVASPLPWCIIGDLNNLMSQAEKIGGALYPNGLIDGFVETMVACGLNDLSMIGYQYTWENGRDEAGWIEERLNRALATNAWMFAFQLAKEWNLEITSSDHYPIFLDPKPISGNKIINRFRFENSWLQKAKCGKVVCNSWGRTTNLSFQGQIESCGKDLLYWSSCITGNFKQRIEWCNRKLKTLRGKPDSASRQ